jgi:hypothetical protein
VVILAALLCVPVNRWVGVPAPVDAVQVRR